MFYGIDQTIYLSEKDQDMDKDQQFSQQVKESLGLTRKKGKNQLISFGEEKDANGKSNKLKGSLDFDNIIADKDKHKTFNSTRINQLKKHYTYTE